MRRQGGPKQRFIFKELYVEDTSLQVGNQANTLKYSKTNSCISYQFRTDVQTYGHRPRYTAENKATESEVCAQKYQVVA
jgi:hypothetical protein